MLYLPKFSVGSLVIVDEVGTEGTISSIEAVLKVGRSGKSTYKVVYLVDIEGIGTKKFFEPQIKDVPEVLPENITELDKFLADSLLLAKHEFPDNKKIENTIKELLKLEAAGGEAE